MCYYRCDAGYIFTGERLEEGCRDINECLEGDNAECEEICNNTIGSFLCDCPEGKNIDEPSKFMPLLTVFIAQ